MRSATQWYISSGNDPCLLLAHEAFKTAVDIFNRDLTSDPVKQTIATGSSTIEELSRIVQSARERYEGKTKDRKLQKWLNRFSLRVRYYGNVLDVLVQHHPEYVSLAWGAFKLLFTVIENNVKLLTTLSKALSQIADSLPRVELSAVLYPTERMKGALVQLYVHVINFLIRARSWYEESSLRRLVNAFARPAELRYDDIIRDIEGCTAEIDHLSEAGARAEQRDMHIQLREMGQSFPRVFAEISELRKLCIETQTINTSGFLDTNRRLTDIQLNGIMENLSKSRKEDPLKLLSQCYHYLMKAQAKTRTRTSPLTVVSNHPKFRLWQSGPGSRLVMVKGDHKTREFVKNLSANTVVAIRQKQLPVVWILKSPLRSADPGISTVELMQDLIHQVLRLNISIHTERSFSLASAQFHAAETATQWFDLLASVLDHLPVLYMVINIEAIDTRLIHSNEGFSWLQSFSSLMGKLKDRQVKTTLKVLLLSHGSATSQEQGNLVRFNDLVLSTSNISQLRV